MSLRPKHQLRIEMVDESPDDLARAMNAFLWSYNETANPIWWQKLLDAANELRPPHVLIARGRRRTADRPIIV